VRVRELVQRLSPEPDPFLLSLSDCLTLLPAGAEAWDLACGSGRHAAWLAGRGYHVTAIDSSAEVLSRTRERSAAVRYLQVDLEAPEVDLGRDACDLICVFYFLHRPLFPAIRAALRPGGLLIYKTYTTDQLRYPGRPRNPLHLLQPNELLGLVEGFRVLRYEEVWEGKGTAAIVAQKPR
jgi:SAM-dependent methyltransferase